jgi:hypothetical protein
MKTRFFDQGDDWTVDGPTINGPETLQNIREVLERDGPIIVEHRHYRGSSAPARLVFDDFNDFIEYLERKASAGDAIDVWSFPARCTAENKLVSGKCPDDQGLVPRQGAY